MSTKCHLLYFAVGRAKPPSPLVFSLSRTRLCLLRGVSVFGKKKKEKSTRGREGRVAALSQGHARGHEGEMADGSGCWSCGLRMYVTLRMPCTYSTIGYVPPYVLYYCTVLYCTSRARACGFRAGCTALLLAQRETTPREVFGEGEYLIRYSAMFRIPRQVTVLLYLDALQT